MSLHSEVVQQRGSLVRLGALGDRLGGCRRYFKFLKTRILRPDDPGAHDAAYQGDVLRGVRDLGQLSLLKKPRLILNSDLLQDASLDLVVVALSGPVLTRELPAPAAISPLQMRSF